MYNDIQTLRLEYENTIIRNLANQALRHFETQRV